LTKEIDPKGGNMKKENEEKRQIYGQQYYQKKAYTPYKKYIVYHVTL